MVIFAVINNAVLRVIRGSSIVPIYEAQYMPASSILFCGGAFTRYGYGARSVMLLRVYGR